MTLRFHLRHDNLWQPSIERGEMGGDICQMGGGWVAGFADNLAHLYARIVNKYEKLLRLLRRNWNESWGSKQQQPFVAPVSSGRSVILREGV